MTDTPERHPPQWTLSGIRDMNLELEAACETPGCGSFVSFNVAALIEKFGAEYWLPENGPACRARNAAGI